jgi:hypothetical protein
MDQSSKEISEFLNLLGYDLKQITQAYSKKPGDQQCER